MSQIPFFHTNTTEKTTCDKIFCTPHDCLKPYIAHYTIAQQQSEKASTTLTLVPDASGCFVFTFDASRYFDAVVWGPTTKTVVVDNDVDTNPGRLFIEFRPGGLFALTGLFQKELTDHKFPLDLICPLLAHALFPAIEQARSVADLVCGLDRVFLAQLIHNTSAFSLSRARGALLSIHSGSVRELARLEHYSERQLNRLFQQQIGMNVKTFAKLVRINQVVEQINQSTIRDFARLAQENGFYDQSHLNHDFHLICGVSPTQYIKNRAEFYNESFKF